MKAAVGDRITVHGLHVGDAIRGGEVIEVKGAGGEPPYVVRWDDGHEAVFVPGCGVRVDSAGAAADGETGWQIAATERAGIGCSCPAGSVEGQHRRAAGPGGEGTGGGQVVSESRRAARAVAMRAELAEADELVVVVDVADQRLAIGRRGRRAEASSCCTVALPGTS